MKTYALAGVTSLLALALVARSEDKKHDHDHEHHAPHHGTLVVCGEEEAHVELVLDAKEGVLTLYVLDECCEKSIRLKQESIEIEVEWPAAKAGDERKKTKIVLKAVEHKLSGEVIGDTSEFTVKMDELKGATEWDGVMTLIEIRGKKYEKVAFNFPKGNEEEEEAPKK